MSNSCVLIWSLDVDLGAKQRCTSACSKGMRTPRTGYAGLVRLAKLTIPSKDAGDHRQVAAMEIRG
eukprot:scaffold41019_cov21-Tisochrysis_lutea.AAC.1